MSQLLDKQSHPDRPWDGRGYGRIRLDEPLAKDLYGIMRDEVSRRLQEYHDTKNSGADALIPKLALRRASTIRERVENLIREQGWEDG